jgi:hypothetical protein
LGGKCILRDIELRDIEVTETPVNSRSLLGLTALKKAAPFTFLLSPNELKLSNCITTVADK